MNYNKFIGKKDSLRNLSKKNKKKNLYKNRPINENNIKLKNQNIINEEKDKISTDKIVNFNNNSMINNINYFNNIKKQKQFLNFFFSEFSKKSNIEEKKEDDFKPKRQINFQYNKDQESILEDKININKYKIKKDIKGKNLNINNNNLYSDNDFFLVILENVGNTTYMNSVLRCLSNNFDFSNFYLNNIDDIKKYMTIMPISYMFSRVLFHLFPNKNIPFQKSYSLDKFHNVIIELNPIFRGKSTKNAIDFLIYFIEQLHEENKYFQKKDEISGNFQIVDSNNLHKYINLKEGVQQSNIFYEFSWINKNVEKCWICNEEKILYQSLFTFDLDFENALNKAILYDNKNLSILDCIKYRIEKENIYNIFCKNCNTKTNFEKQSSILLTRKSIIFLNRGFEKNKIINAMNSNNIRIKINEKLDLSNLTGIKNSVYYLNGLILYNIVELEYIAYSINPTNKKWYKYIKEKIISIELKDFINEYDSKLFPAILFYGKI